MSKTTILKYPMLSQNQRTTANQDILFCSLCHQKQVELPKIYKEHTTSKNRYILQGFKRAGWRCGGSIRLVSPMERLERLTDYTSYIKIISVRYQDHISWILALYK